MLYLMPSGRALAAGQLPAFLRRFTQIMILSAAIKTGAAACSPQRLLSPFIHCRHIIML